MLFGKRKEFDEKKIEQVMEDFINTMGELMEKHLPRRIRRTMRKNKGGWGKISNKDMEDIKKRGLSSWLNETVDKTYQEIEPFAKDPGALEKDLKISLKELKKKWKIK